MKVLVTGADGQLGTDLCRVLQSIEVIPCTQNDFEITDASAVRSVFRSHHPDAIINTAAYVRVDDCEDKKDKAFAVNTLGARNIAVASQEIGAKLVHISTDYVFGGTLEPRFVPYTEFDTPSPCNVYGRSKLAGEELVRHLCARYFVVRTSGLFGTAGSLGKGGNFIETIINLAGRREMLSVVNDQVFSPTYARDLAGKIGQLLQTECYGVYHITNKGACSWYEFAKATFSILGIGTPVVPITSSLYPQKASRPIYSVLDNYHLHLMGMDDMRTWQDALRDYLVSKGHLKQEN